MNLFFFCFYASQTHVACAEKASIIIKGHINNYISTFTKFYKLGLKKFTKLEKHTHYNET